MRPITKSVFLLFLAATAYAQGSIQLCGVELHLGLAKDKTLQGIGENCTTRTMGQVGDQEVWCVKAHGDKRAPNDCDIVAFTEGRLTSIKREIKSLESVAAADLANALFLVVREAEQRHETITLRTQQEYERDGYRYRTISFFISGNMIDLDITQPVGIPNGGSSASLSENLFGDPLKPSKKSAK